MAENSDTLFDRKLSQKEIEDVARIIKAMDDVKGGYYHSYKETIGEKEFTRFGPDRDKIDALKARLFGPTANGRESDTKVLFDNIMSKIPGEGVTASLERIRLATTDLGLPVRRATEVELSEIARAERRVKN